MADGLSFQTSGGFGDNQNSVDHLLNLVEPNTNMEHSGDDYLNAANGTNEGPSLSVIADGQYLRDMSGNIVGTLNEDGTYSLIEGLTTNSFLNETANGNDAVTKVEAPQTTQENVLEKQPQISEPVEEAKESTIEIPPKSNNTSQETPSEEPQRMDSYQKVEVKTSNPGEPITITTPVSKKGCTPITIQNSAPLGSSANPIRIIQQGNSYTSTQELTSEQLQQIMQVVQQQQALKEAQEAGQQKVIYNPKTQTKIVYKVVNPSPGSANKRTPGIRHGKKRPRSKQSETDEDEMAGRELTSKEKEERKRRIPKTRSGRVSKPPKHMIEDYKHLHLVDWKEDYDDSDGGYSDYKGETDEEEREAKRVRIEDEKKKREEAQRTVFKCEECDKSFNSKKGLAIHYENQPSHKPFTDDKDDTATGVDGSGSKKVLWNRNTKRYKLKEMMSRCPDDVLLDVMLPKLCSMVSAWEFLLMKIEDEHPDMDVTFPMIYKEFEALRQKARHAFEENMRGRLLEKVDDKLYDPSDRTSKFNYCCIRRKDSAESIGAQVGTYRLTEKGKKKPDFMLLSPSKPDDESRLKKSYPPSLQPQVKPGPSKPNNKIEVTSVPRKSQVGDATNKEQNGLPVQQKDTVGMSSGSANITISSKPLVDNISRKKSLETNITVNSTNKANAPILSAATPSRSNQSALSTSVINKTARNAAGVVSDMSDLDVWDQPSTSQTPRSSQSSSVSSTPTRVSSQVNSAANKMVSIIGRQPTRGTVQIASETKQALSVEQTFVGPDVSGVQATAATSDPKSVISADGELQIPEGVQMVIQHPDGSYQLIDNPEEAKRLMEQAEELEAEGGSKPNAENAEQVANDAAGQTSTEIQESATVEGGTSGQVEGQIGAAENIADALIEASTAFANDKIGDESQAAASETENQQENTSISQHATSEDGAVTVGTNDEALSEEQAAMQLAALNPENVYASAASNVAADTSAAAVISSTEQGVAYSTSTQEESQLVQSSGGQSLLTSSAADAQLAATSQAEEAAVVSADMAAGGDAQDQDPASQTLIFQTDDGLILIRQPDGNFQVQSTTGAPINMDTVRALINQLQLM